MKLTFTLCLAALLFVLSWSGLLWLAEMVSWSLAPYEAMPFEQRLPPAGWQSALSDFFQYSVGSQGLAAVLTGLNLALFLGALRRLTASPGGWLKLLVGFALANLATAASVTVISFVVANLAVDLAPYPGYGWTVKFLVPQFFLLGCWLVLQARCIPGWAARHS